MLNKTWENKPGKFSKTLTELDEDFQTIRNHLWDCYCKGEFANYKQPIKQSMEKKKKVYTSDDGGINELRLLNLKKISLQSFFCQTEESFHLIKVVEFLRYKYLSYTENTRKKVELNVKHTLFVIPFFDGIPFISLFEFYE